MIRLDRFRISDRPYAVNPPTLKVEPYQRQDGATRYRVDIDAVWFRRRKGTTVAVAGALWDYQDHGPLTVAQALAAHDDGRYGGSAFARWDGSNLWAPSMPKSEQDRYYELLKAALDGFPEVPAGYDGWWTFKVPA